MKVRVKPILGQVLYSLNVGNAARHRKQELTEVKVTKVGNKYFECTEKGFSRPTVYNLDNWCEKTEYMANSSLYENPQQLEEERAVKEISSFIYESFEYRQNRLDLSLEILRKIESLMKD